MASIYIIQTIHYARLSTSRYNNINTHIIVGPMANTNNKQLSLFAVHLRPQHTKKIINIELHMTMTQSHCMIERNLYYSL